MTVIETIEKDKDAAEIYNFQKENYELRIEKQTLRRYEDRIIVRLYKVVHKRKFPFIFMKKVKKFEKIDLPYELFEDPDGAELYLKEFILFKAGFYFETKNRWFEPSGLLFD